MDGVEIALRRHDAPAGPYHRLGNEGGDGVGTLAQDQRFDIGGKPGGEVRLAPSSAPQ
jgi:hypothetical protein